MGPYIRMHCPAALGDVRLAVSPLYKDAMVRRSAWNGRVRALGSARRRIVALRAWSRELFASLPFMRAWAPVPSVPKLTSPPGSEP